MLEKIIKLFESRTNRASIISAASVIALTLFNIDMDVEKIEVLVGSGISIVSSAAAIYYRINAKVDFTDKQS